MKKYFSDLTYIIFLCGLAIESKQFLKLHHMLWLGLCDSVTIRFYIFSNFKLQQMCFDCISSPTSNAWISKYSVHVSYLKRYFYNIYVVKHIYCTITFPDKIKFYHDEKYCVVIVLLDKIILSFKIVFRSQFFFVE